MMELFQIFILALIQGLTEFLPISSSAHLLLPKELLGWEDQGLVFDVAVHVGTLMAVLIYFRKDLLGLLSGGCATLVGRSSNDGRLAWYLVAATIPVCVAGLLFEDMVESHLRTATVIAWATFLGAILLWYAYKTGSVSKEMGQITLVAAVLIGVAQVFALVPGTSRSGITITMALLLGFTATSAARFSFLLSIPVIAISGAWQGIGLIGQDDISLTPLLLGVSVSGVSAFLTIHFFLRVLERIGMMPFVWYRLALAGLLFLLVASG